MSSTTVVVADSQKLFTDSVAGALEGHRELSVVSERPTTGQDAVDVAVARRADIVLMDYWIRGMSGPTAARAMVRARPELRVVFLAGYYVGRCQRREAHAAGALGFVKKSASLEELISCVRVVAASVTQAGAVRTESGAFERFFTLTPREIDVLQMLGYGLPTKELARHFRLSVGTVKNHISSIMTKLGVATQLEAVTLAMAEGVIAPSSPPAPGVPA